VQTTLDKATFTLLPNSTSSGFDQAFGQLLPWS
jgi:hypothetical protein